MVFMKKLHVLNGRSAVAARRALPGVFVLAMAVACLVFAGCRKEEKVDPSSPESYMKDAAFRQKLSAERKARQELLSARAHVVSEMKAMIDAKKKELNTTDLAKVKEELDKDPAWQALYSKCTNANAKVDAHRAAQLKTVRERLAPKKPISK